jgi:hypothetical protein
MALRRLLIVLGLLLALSVGCSGQGQHRSMPTATDATNGAPPPARVCRGVLVIDGIFDPTGTTLTRLDPVHCYARASGPVPNQTHGMYVVQTIYADGTQTSLLFDALVADDAGHVYHGFFEIVQPVNGAIVQVRIATSDGSKTFAEIAGSAIIGEEG